MLQYSNSITVGSQVLVSGQVKRSSDFSLTARPTPPASIPGTLTTQSPPVLDVPSGHGLTTGSRVCLVWGAPGTSVRGSYAVSATTSTTITLSGSPVGDALPADGEPVTVLPGVATTLAIVAGKLRGLGFNVSAAGAARSPLPTIVDFLHGPGPTRTTRIAKIGAYVWTDMLASAPPYTLTDALESVVIYAQAQAAQIDVVYAA